jgi:hypothetical protein
MDFSDLMKLLTLTPFTRYLCPEGQDKGGDPSAR